MVTGFGSEGAHAALQEVYNKVSPHNFVCRCVSLCVCLFVLVSAFVYVFAYQCRSVCLSLSPEHVTI